MSAEKNLDVEQNPSTFINPKANRNKFSGRVDINHLLARVRKEQKQESKTNMIFFGMFSLLVLTVGIILSF